MGWGRGRMVDFCSVREAVFFTDLGSCAFSMQLSTLISRKIHPPTDDHCIYSKVWTVEYI